MTQAYYDTLLVDLLHLANPSSRIRLAAVEDLAKLSNLLRTSD